MSRFTIKNLKDVENSVGERIPGAEGRFARKHLDSEHLGVSYFRYPARLRRIPLRHHHRDHWPRGPRPRRGLAITCRPRISATQVELAAAVRKEVTRIEHRL